MKYTVALMALAAAVSAQTPPGCSGDFSGSFEISPVNVTGSSKRDLALYKRQTSACTSTPIITLKGGKLLDQQGRTGEIVSNSQFQFDNPTQSGALFTSGFSVCSNGTLAVGGSAIFYSCLSGDFANLYHASQGGQCYPVYIDTIACTNPSGSAVAASAPASTSAPAASSAPASSAPVSSAPISSAHVSSAPASSAPASVAPITTPAPAPAPAPFSRVNTTSPAAPTGSAPAKSATASAPATFTPGSGANMLAVGSKLVAGAAAIAAFAMI